MSKKWRKNCIYSVKEYENGNIEQHYFCKTKAKLLEVFKSWVAKHPVENDNAGGDAIQQLNDQMIAFGEVSIESGSDLFGIVEFDAV